MKKNWNCFKSEIKRAYKFYQSPRYLLYPAWLSDYSSKTTKYIWILSALKSLLDPALKDKKELLKIPLKIKSGQRRNCWFYCIFTFLFAVILLFLKNYQRYSNSVFTETLQSETHRQSERQTDTEYHQYRWFHSWCVKIPVIMFSSF